MAFIPSGLQTFFGSNGTALSLGSVAFYVPGTLTLKDTWSDTGLTTLNTNPVLLDALGRASVWGTGSYRQIAKDALGNTIFDRVVDSADASVLSNLASTEGAAMVGVEGGGTVQGVVNELLNLSASAQVSSATTLTSTSLNTVVVFADGAASYSVALPPVTSGDVGAALKVICARDCSKVVTLAAASASGLLVDGEASVDFIAGESATVLFDGAKWLLLDRVRVPFAAEMLNSGATVLTIDAFNDLPFPAAGQQLMQADLSALWNYSGGYFTAPRAGTYLVEYFVWLSQTGAPSQADVGVYQATTGGGSPLTKYFARINLGGYTYQTQCYVAELSLGKGEKVFVSIRPLGSANGGTLTACSVVDSATLLSRLSITEIVR